MVSSEANLQASFFQEISKRRRENPLYNYIVAIPNEQRAGARAAGYMIRQGMSSGFPDVFCFLARKGFCGMAIEFKTEKGKQSEQQKQWEQWLRAEGYIYLLMTKKTVAVKLIEWYIG